LEKKKRSKKDGDIRGPEKSPRKTVHIQGRGVVHKVEKWLKGSRRIRMPDRYRYPSRMTRGREYRRRTSLSSLEFGWGGGRPKFGDTEANRDGDERVTFQEGDEKIPIKKRTFTIAARGYTKEGKKGKHMV